MTRSVGRHLAMWTGETRALWRESTSLPVFLRLMQVRLSLSKVGRLVCPRPKTIVVDLHSFGRNVHLRSHTSDISVLDELSHGATYEPVARLVTAPVRWVVDLGANCGLSARWFLHRFPEASVVCVEPEASNLEVARRNLSDFEDRSVVVPACVGGWSRQVALTSHNKEFSFAMHDVEDGQPGDADVVTMDVVLRHLGDAPVDVLKCDIEGAEEELFAECADWVDRVRVAAVECHGDYTTQSLVAALHRNGVAPTVVQVQRAPDFGCEVATLSVRRGA